LKVLEGSDNGLILYHEVGILLQELRVTTRFSQNGQSTDGDLNPRPTECEGVLTFLHAVN